MATNLPYRATTASGERLDISFPLHAHTASPMRVAQIVSAILEAVDSEVKLDPNTSNGDVVQAVAMALAIRAAMIEASSQTTAPLVRDLVNTALAAANDARRHYAH